jgi:HAD superfamily hydrolase (TIGR01509 family)
MREDKAIIFDFFGVICSEIAPIWTRRRLPQCDVHDIHERYIRAGDEGTRSEEAVFKDLATVARIQPADIAREWQDLIQIDEAVIDIIREVKKSHKTALCSNAWSSFIRPILSAHNLEELFDTIVISSEVGITKPDERIFRLVATQVDAEPTQCIFIDDGPRNISAAQAMGMTSILFSSAEDLRTELGLTKDCLS